MKSVVATAAIVATVQGASAPYETAFQELTGCHLSFGSCLRLGSGNVDGFVPLSEPDCILANATGADTTSWYKEFASADAFEAASTSSSQTIKLVRFKDGTTVEDFKSGLPSGADVDSYLFCDAGTYAFVDVSPPATVAEFEIALPDVLKINPLSRESAASANVLVRLAPSARGTFDQVVAKLSARHAEGRRLAQVNEDSVMQVLPQSRLNPADQVSTVIISASSAGNELEFLASLPEVAMVEPYVQPKLSNNEAALITMEGIENEGRFTDGDNVATSQPERLSLWQSGIDGSGQIVGVGDSGLDTEHLFFADPSVNEAAVKVERIKNIGAENNNLNHRKVTQYVAYADGFEGEELGHGSHVSGSVAGSVPPEFAAACSSVKVGDLQYEVNAADFVGMAPGAKIAFFDIGVAGQRFLKVPTDVGDVFRPSYAQGARIHTNSWGSSISGYLSDSQSIDKFAYEHQDMLLLFANSNDGPGLTTTSSEATSKNVVSVGASQNSGRSSGLVTAAWTNPREYVCYSNRVAGVNPDLSCAQSMAYFSSSGPTFDNRIKPDIVAPGQWIFSSKSVGGDGSTAQPHCDIEDLQGTSMATPVTAGNTALIRQFFVDGYYPTGIANAQDGFNPMGALVKAVLVDGAEFIRGVSPRLLLSEAGDFLGFGLAANHSDVTAPGPYQGFGRINLRNTLKLEGSNTKDVRNVFVKGDFADMPTLTRAADSQTFNFNMENSGEDLKATLVWYDPAASTVATKALVNDLDIKVVDPNGKVYYPNGLNQADRLNTVEKVVVPASEIVPGEYVVTVSAHKLNMDNQPFAIVVSGTFAGTTFRPTMSPTVSPTMSPTMSPTDAPAPPQNATSSPTKSPAAPAESSDSTVALVLGIVGSVVGTIAFILFGIKYFKPVEEEVEDYSETKIQAANPKYDV